MQYRAILDVADLADGDRLIVSTDYTQVPHAGKVTNRDATNQVCALGNECTLVNLRDVFDVTIARIAVGYVPGQERLSKCGMNKRAASLKTRADRCKHARFAAPRDPR